MGIADETSGTDASQLASLLAQVRDGLDLGQEVTFQVYTRVVLPLDGYVFWSPLVAFRAKGALHWSQELLQHEDETLGFATVQFTTSTPIQELSSLGNNRLCVASVGGFRYAFSQQNGFFRAAGMWHYFGHSVEPALASQLLDDPSAIDLTQPVVSDSLPLWLALNGWSTPFEDWLSNAPANEGGLGLTLYPSFIVTPNLTPPYVTVHIGPDDTRPLQAVPYLDANRSSWQLCADRVRLTLYGLQNNAAIDFLNCVLQYIEYTGNFGLMNMPTVRDGKRNQVELQALAMQKIIDFEVSYTQARVASVARTLITNALPITYIFEGGAAA